MLHLRVRNISRASIQSICYTCSSLVDLWRREYINFIFNWVRMYIARHLLELQLGLVGLSSLRLYNHVTDQFSASNWPETEKPLKWTADCQDNSWSRFAGICCCQTVPLWVGWDLLNYRPFDWWYTLWAMREGGVGVKKNPNYVNYGLDVCNI